MARPLGPNRPTPQTQNPRSVPRASRAPRGSRRAFTLVEMIVVLAIIGMLAFLLLPVMSQAEGQKYRLGCQANLKTVFQSTTAWAANNNQQLPPFFARQENPFDPGTRLQASMLAFKTNRVTERGHRRPHNLAVLVTDDILKKPESLYCPAAGQTGIFSMDRNVSRELPYDKYEPEKGDGDVAEIPGTLDPSSTYIGFTYQGRAPYASSMAQLNSAEMLAMDVFFDIASVFHPDPGWNILLAGGSVDFRVNKDIYNELGVKQRIGQEYKEFEPYRRRLEQSQ